MSETNEGIFSCKGICWIIGALLGLAAFLILRGRMEMGFFLALLISVVLLVAVALLLQRFFCGEIENTIGISSTAGSPAPAPAAKSAAALDSSAADAKPADAPAAPAEVKKSDASGADGGSKSADRGKESSSKTVKTTKAKKAPAKPAPAKKPAAKPAAGESKPETLSGAREGGADNLKLLKGVGPKLEQTLNDLGFYHFDQVAAWGKAEVEWVDSRLTFKGRIERDDWISQAKTLAEGGSTEFSNKAKKGK